MDIKKRIGSNCSCGVTPRIYIFLSTKKCTTLYLEVAGFGFHSGLILYISFLLPGQSFSQTYMSLNSYKEQPYLFLFFSLIKTATFALLSLNSYFVQVSISFRHTSFYLSNHSITSFQVLLENLQRIDTACCTDLKEVKKWEDVCTLYSQALHCVTRPQQGTSSPLIKFCAISCRDANYVVDTVFFRKNAESAACVFKGV